MDNQPAPRLFEALNRYKWSSLALALVVVAISVVTALLTGPHGAVATTSLALKAPAKTDVVGTDLTGSDLISEASFVRYVQQRALFLTSDRVLQQARTYVPDAPPLDQLRTQVATQTATTGESITLTVTADSTLDAVGEADAIVKAYRTLSQADATAAANQALNTLGKQRAALVAGTPAPQAGKPASPDSAALASELAQLDQQSAAISVAGSQFGDGVAFANAAAPAPSALGNSLLRDTAIGVVVGILLAVAVAWVRADRDRRASDAADLGATPGAPVLAEIAELDRLAWDNPHDDRARALPAYQVALTGLRSAVQDGVVVVTGSGPRSGATTSALYLAIAAARDGSRVCVVDAAVDSHRLTDMLQLGGLPGMSALATGTSTVAECTHPALLSHNTMLYAVPAGVPGRVAGFQSALLDKAVNELRHNFDLVLVDTPPLTDAPEVAPLVRASDGVLLVARRGGSLDVLERTRQRITVLGGALVGYLFTFSARVQTWREDSPTTSGVLR
jgi:polysaccharide biosynthesis transport protein